MGWYFIILLLNITFETQTFYRTPAPKHPAHPNSTHPHAPPPQIAAPRSARCIILFLFQSLFLSLHILFCLASTTAFMATKKKLHVALRAEEKLLRGTVQAQAPAHACTRHVGTRTISGQANPGPRKSFYLLPPAAPAFAFSRAFIAAITRISFAFFLAFRSE